MSVSSKKAIKTVVEEYIKLFPEEFDTFKTGMTGLRHMTRDDLASLYGSDYSRALYEMPETLSTMLITRLPEEAMVWLKAGGRDGKAGGLWFARTFKDFAIPNKV